MKTTVRKLDLDPAEPRWPAIIAIIATAGLELALPESLAAGPRWLAPIVVLVLITPVFITHRRGHRRANQILGQVLSAAITFFMLWSLVLLIRALPAHTESPVALLGSALSLWITNVLVFALWYWRLDAGGPNGRDMRRGHPDGAFLFPQMTLPPDERPIGEVWSPQFIDYLFLAFNTSTAFSPTDAPILSRWAKGLVMLQASISLTVVVLLAARAVNIL